MEEVKSFYRAINEICVCDQRYKPDGYEFVMQALNFTQKEFKKEGHISGQELLEGIRKFALDQYGPMAKTVLQHWGITRTSDFGNIVFNMIGQKLLSKTESDTRHDFDDVYDFKTAFKYIVKDLQI
jgi:uncharacterized repeat protein (TIGR04138 family)